HERIGELDEDAGTVAKQRVVSGRTAMGEVLQDLKTLSEDRVALLALDVRDESEAAGVVLVRRIVQSLPLWGEGGRQVLQIVYGRPHRPHCGKLYTISEPFSAWAGHAPGRPCRPPCRSESSEG